MQAQAPINVAENGEEQPAAQSVAQSASQPAGLRSDHRPEISRSLMSGQGTRDIAPPGASSTLQTLQESVASMKCRLEMRQLEKALAELEQPASGPRAAGSDQGALVAELVRALGQVMSGVVSSLAARSSPDSERLAELITEIRSMRGSGDNLHLARIREELAALRGELRGRSSLRDLAHALSSLRDLAGEVGPLLAGAGGSTGGWVALLKDSLPSILEVIGQLRASQTRSAGGAAGAAGGLAAAAAPSAPAAAGGSAVGGVPPGGRPPVVPSDDPVLAILRRGVFYLKGKAASRSDPGLYAELILDGLTEAQWQPFVSLAREADVGKLAELAGDPELLQSPYRQWFEALLGQVRGGLEGGATGAPEEAEGTPE
jgi:hypothetical protein